MGRGMEFLGAVGIIGSVVILVVVLAVNLS